MADDLYLAVGCYVLIIGKPFWIFSLESGLKDLGDFQRLNDIICVHYSDFEGNLWGFFVCLLGHMSNLSRATSHELWKSVFVQLWCTDNMALRPC